MRGKPILVIMLMVLLNSCATEHEVSVRSPLSKTTVGRYLVTDALRVPPLIDKTFKECYPGAQQVSWTNELEDYVVNFVFCDKLHQIYYDEQAKPLEHKVFISIQKINSQLQSIIAQNHPAQKVIQAYYPKSDDQGILVVRFEDQSEAYYRISSVKKEMGLLK